MGEKYLFPEWRNQNERSRYPFTNSATLTNGVDTLPVTLFVDARVFPIGGGARQYLSRITVQTEDIQFTIGDENTAELAFGYYVPGSATEVIPLLDAYSRPAGMLVGAAEQLATFSTWGVGAHAFELDQTEFSATVTVPQPQPGVRGFLAEGELFAGDAYMVGEQGVFLTMDGEYIRVDIVGDPRARQRFCEQLFSFDQPMFLRTINGYGPDDFGDFKLLAGGQLASDTALRIEALPNGLGLKLIGSVLVNAPN